ncbi:unnamed protein product [Amoebophrya sp. A25]|nr:unnamed protein product [Amoebophrya sp. A25]|eukprot:GSA25T00020311001.1
MQVAGASRSRKQAAGTGDVDGRGAVPVQRRGRRGRKRQGRDDKLGRDDVTKNYHNKNDHTTKPRGGGGRGGGAPPPSTTNGENIYDKMNEREDNQREDTRDLPVTRARGRGRNPNTKADGVPLFNKGVDHPAGANPNMNNASSLPIKSKAEISAERPAQTLLFPSTRSNFGDHSRGPLRDYVNVKKQAFKGVKGVDSISNAEADAICHNKMSKMKNMNPHAPSLQVLEDLLQKMAVAGAKNGPGGSTSYSNPGAGGPLGARAANFRNVLEDLERARELQHHGGNSYAASGTKVGQENHNDVEEFLRRFLLQNNISSGTSRNEPSSRALDVQPSSLAAAASVPPPRPGEQQELRQLRDEIRQQVRQELLLEQAELQEASPTSSKTRAQLDQWAKKLVLFGAQMGRAASLHTSSQSSAATGPKDLGAATSTTALVSNYNQKYNLQSSRSPTNDTYTKQRGTNESYAAAALSRAGPFLGYDLTSLSAKNVDGTPSRSIDKTTMDAFIQSRTVTQEDQSCSRTFLSPGDVGAFSPGSNKWSKHNKGAHREEGTTDSSEATLRKALEAFALEALGDAVEESTATTSVGTTVIFPAETITRRIWVVKRTALAMTRCWHDDALMWVIFE